MIISEMFSYVKAPLPGWEAQKLMSSVGYDQNREPKGDSKIAAIMVLLFQDEEQAWQTVYIKRPSRNPLDKHSGQISYPGGQREATDHDLIDTALRETEEELGIPRSEIEIIGPLSSIYVFVSDFNVFPYVGYLSAKPQFDIQKSEVDFPIIYPLQRLLNSNPVPRKNLTVAKGRTLKNIPYYDLDGHTLWGATAMVTSELLEMVRRGKGWDY